MLNHLFYGQHGMEMNELTMHASQHSISIYLGTALAVAVLITGSLAILGLSVFNRIDPALNTTVIFHRSDLPPLTNQSVKDNRDVTANGVERRR
jgi:hypothetical protein